MTPAAYPRVLIHDGSRHREWSARFVRNARSSSRAGSPLLFGLAPRGVFRASGVSTGAVGSYPTFSPLPNVACISSASRRFPCAMPPCSLRRRSILCGTFRGAPSGTGFSLRSPLRPLALPGALPCQEFRSPQSEERASGRCPDFPPAQPSRDDQASDHPARPPLIL